MLSTQVSTLALSKSGRYLASGQVTYMGFTADVIIWDLETRQLMHRLALHKVRSTALHLLKPAALVTIVSHTGPHPIAGLLA